MQTRSSTRHANSRLPRFGTLCTACVCIASAAFVGQSYADNLLIIAAPDYVDSTPLNQYIAAREARGFQVDLYSPASGTDRSEIRNHILTLWGTPDEPDFILIVGDTDGATSAHDSIPYWSGGGSKGSPTDLPYACDNSEIEWYPDAFIGRWSCRNTTHLQNIVDKTLFIEAGNYPDPDYFKRSAFLANPSTNGMSEPSHNYVINNLLEPYGHTGIKIYASQGGGTSDVTNAINNGVLFTVYYGHSSSSGWWDPGFTSGNVNSLSNTGMYGLACGWSCQTAMFTTSECFGEAWIRAADKGAAAYISASDYIYWGSVAAWQPSTDLEAGFFRAMYEDEIWEVGPAWQAGLFHFLETFGDWDGNRNHEPSANQDICRNFFEEFVILGDPSLRLPGALGFEVYCDPASHSICAQATDEVVFDVDVQSVGNFLEPVTLTAQGVPDGAGVIFSENGQVAPYTSTLTIDDLSSVAPGHYQIKVTGTSESKVNAYFADLYVSDDVPGGVTLISPADGAGDNPIEPTLVWSPASQGADYDLEIAEDVEFNNIVYAVNTMETRHVVETELERATQYYWRVRGANACGIGVFSAPYAFMTYTEADYFTEAFDGGFDLDGYSVSFIPDGTGDYYSVCGETITELPTVPEGGLTVHLIDDGYGEIELFGGKAIPFYGVDYESYFVCSNGYITFGAGDTDNVESLADHFDLPRISGLFDDLTPAEGVVRCRQYIDRVTVSFLNVPERGAANSNTFQMEMFFDGKIKLSWLGIDSTDAIVGLSAGAGIPDDFEESDLTDVEPCLTTSPPAAQDVQANTPANTPVLLTLTATDDGQPDPPAAMDYTIVWGPSHGVLTDPIAGVIDSYPHVLTDGGAQVQYSPAGAYVGEDGFGFKANDGGVYPGGGDSNIAEVEIHVLMPAPELVYSFPMDSDPGWSVEGQWEFGAPTGAGSHNRDPHAAYTGANVYGYNLSGDYANGMSAYSLTTTALDCGDLRNVRLSFWRWLGVERTPFDSAAVEVSNDGSTWTPIWQNGDSNITDLSWTQLSFDISSVADAHETVYVRWIIGPTDDQTTYPGWNIDDVEITASVLSVSCPGDLDGDNDVDLSDLAQLLAHYGLTTGVTYADGDLDGDGDVDLSDLAALLSVYGESC